MRKNQKRMKRRKPENPPLEIASTSELSAEV
jgi:hypothetical protein